ncbi:MAG TPA: DsbA family protein [Thermoleophilaceae bacterium]
MAVGVQYFTDPASVWSWGAEPKIRKLMVEFGDSLSWTYVMGGLVRQYELPAEREQHIIEWLSAADDSAMPVDPRLWTEGPISSTFPACMAVKAAAEQADDGGYGYLRALREGLMCFRRKLDTTEALVEEARSARLNVERFRVDLGSHAIVEAFGADLEATRGATSGQDGERLPFPTVVFGGSHVVHGPKPYEDYRAAALAAGAEPGGAEVPGVLDAVKRFGRMATAEVMEVCELPEPRAALGLWQLAAEWKLRPVKVLTGLLWETT